MKKLYHACYTSHNEILCRDNEDYERLLCRIAQTSINSGSPVLAYTIMSNHVHIILLSDNPAVFVKNLRQSYTRSFNKKYLRHGNLGEHGFFSSEISTPDRIATAISYVLRNPVHHKVSPNPFSYPYSSINLYFRGRLENLFKDDNSSCKPLKGMFERHRKIHKDLSFSESGKLDPASFVEIPLVERCFGTYNTFQFFIQRKDYSKWNQEQLESHPDIDPITLKIIEPMLSVESIVKYERHGIKWLNEDAMTDIELCTLIDRALLPKMNKSSYTELSFEEKLHAASLIMAKYKLPKEQIDRCLALSASY